MNAGDFRRLALRLEGADRGFAHGSGGFSGGRPYLRDSRIGESRLRKPYAYARSTSRICRKSIGRFLPVAGGGA